MAPRKVYIICENDAWFDTYKNHLEREGLECIYWDLKHEHLYNFGSEPPKGVFLNKMSCSFWQRCENPRTIKDKGSALIAWLLLHKRRVINGPEGIDMELSKLNQILKLEKFGINVPKTLFIFGPQTKLSGAEPCSLAEDVEKSQMKFPVVLKPNCGGRGYKVSLANSVEEIQRYITRYDFNSSPDDVILIQEYIKSSKRYNLRLHFMEHSLVYATKSANEYEYGCPGGNACRLGDHPKFEVLAKFDHPIVQKLSDFTAHHGLDLVSFDVVERSSSAEAYVYGIHMNARYNKEAERQAGVEPAFSRLAQMLKNALAEE